MAYSEIPWQLAVQTAKRGSVGGSDPDSAAPLCTNWIEVISARTAILRNRQYALKGVNHPHTNWRRNRYSS